jgi:hypothetical protein
MDFFTETMQVNSFVVYGLILYAFYSYEKNKEAS